MRRDAPRGRRLAVVAAVTAAVPLAVGGPVAHAAAGGVTSFAYTGAEQTYVVPAGVTSVSVVAVGAAGVSVGGSDGGLGAVARADVAVTAGQILYVEVGGQTGFNGGAVPGAGLAGVNGGHGGGATDVRTIGVAAGGSLGSRIVVAAGGGGAGGSRASDTGSDGGDAGTAGSPSTQCGTSDIAPGCGGGAATSTLGGAAGLGGATSGLLGLLGLGGAGGLGVDNGGGGGGGGLFGGGGGGAENGDAPGGGGGGGSSGFGAGTSATSVSIATSQSAEVTITPSYQLSVAKTGNGSGTITATGISCGNDCTQQYPTGTAVTLHASAAAGSAFTGWSGGGCTGTGSCVLTVTAAVTVHAAFAKRPPNTSITKVTLTPKTATFRFTSTGATTRFQCAKAKLGAALTFTTCRSPRKYTGFAPGRYTFKVRAVGPGGTDPTPAVRTVTIKAT